MMAITQFLEMTSHFPAGSLAAAFAALLAATLLVQVVHKRFFHPLSSVPGPIANSISELPATLALVRGEQHLYYRWLHEKYGSVVRISPNELSFISPEARQEIYGLRKGGLNMEKSPIFLGAVGDVDGQRGVSLALNAEHTRQRGALGFLFTNSALLQQENLIRIHISKLVAVLKEMSAKGQAVDVSSWYTYTAFDIMGELCFAEPFGCLDKASATEWSTSVINVFVAATWTQGIRRLSGVGTWLEYLLVKLLVPKKAANWRRIHLDNSREKTIRRLKDENRDHPDFIYQILNTESKKGLSQGEVVLNVALFISAGTDTTATALTGWTYFVCTHPYVYQRVVSEIRKAFATEDEIRWQKVNHLQYLEATVNEALRLFPPSAASQQRIVPSGGATIDGYYVPAGMTVAVSPWASTRSCLNFKDPDGFRPERWFQDDGNYTQDKLKASLPFGTGPRVCIGRNLVYLEIRLLLCHLLWSFDIELDQMSHREKNSVWGLDGKLKPPKVFHSMTKPELWVRLRDVTL